MPFVATCRDLEILILSEVRQRNMYMCVCVYIYIYIYIYNLSVKYIYITCVKYIYVYIYKYTLNKWAHLQNRNRLRKQTSGSHGVRMGEGDRVEDWDWHVHTAVFKTDNQQEIIIRAQGTLLNTL